MPLIDPTDPRPIHFMGIAGAGMSGLAELYQRRGASVTGCDATGSTSDLERLGLSVDGGHDPAHVEGCRALVVSSAIPKDHPEVMAARAKGLPVIRRAEALGEAVNDGELVGIAGTHGKTTTTVMTTEALRAAGRDPTGVVGGRVAAWQGNLRAGSEPLYVVESDEYDRSFLALKPTVAAVTNLEADHLDIYGSLDAIREAFAEFVQPARAIVLCDDDAGASSLPLPTGAQVFRYGIDSGNARVLARALRDRDGGVQFVVEYDGQVVADVALRVPGRHNVLNALAAMASGLALGADASGLAAGLGGFTGVERRFQRVGESGGITIVDDYAHHPTELRATIAAGRTAFPGRRLIAAFQPHLFSRTRDFAREFGHALAAADVVFLTEIYPAREQPIAGVSAELIAEEVRRAGRSIDWRGERGELAGALADVVRDGDVVLTLGAGDITRTGAELLRVLETSR